MPSYSSICLMETAGNAVMALKSKRCALSKLIFYLTIIWSSTGLREPRLPAPICPLTVNNVGPDGADLCLDSRAGQRLPRWLR